MVLLIDDAGGEVIQYKDVKTDVAAAIKQRECGTWISEIYGHCS